MKTRCYHTRAKDYHRYGGSGIYVCAEWRRDFAEFRRWALSNGYDDTLFIDRINYVGSYEPANCRWLTARESARHTRAVKLDFAKAEEIRELAAGGLTHEFIAKEFRVSRSNVSLICEGKLWVE
jgi:hypothetical protein